MNCNMKEIRLRHLIGLALFLAHLSYPKCPVFKLLLVISVIVRKITIIKIS